MTVLVLAVVAVFFVLLIAYIGTGMLDDYERSLEDKS